MSQAFSKIWIVIIVMVLVAGGIFAWQYLEVEKEKPKAPEKKIKEVELPEKEIKAPKPDFFSQFLINYQLANNF